MGRTEEETKEAKRITVLHKSISDIIITNMTPLWFNIEWAPLSIRWLLLMQVVVVEVLVVLLKASKADAHTTLRCREMQNTHCLLSQQWLKKFLRHHFFFFGKQAVCHLIQLHENTSLERTKGGSCLHTYLPSLS